MRSVRYDTERGPGWVGFEGERVGCIVLPGGHPPGEEADPPPEAARLAGLAGDWFAGEGRDVVHADLCRKAGRAPFEQAVYQAVSEIEPGSTRTYSEVAALAGRPAAARAVGAAMSRNPFAPLIPCHRVVGSDGSLRGYGGGVEMKADLLREESADV